MAALNIKFADGNELLSYNDYSDYSPGCPTCDYGSKYINAIDIFTTNYHIEITFNQMYRYAMETAQLIVIFARADYNHISEEEFVKYIDEQFHEIGEPEKFEVTKRESKEE